MSDENKVAIYSTDDYAVTIETYANKDVPTQRQRCYFVRHKVHQVVELVTPILGEAIINCALVQKTLEAALANPLDADQRTGMAGGGFKGLN